MQISVMPSDWGDARLVDIRVLLTDVASQVERSLRDTLTSAVVVPSPDTDPYPMTHYRLSPGDPFVVQLSARHKLWAKFAYQFAHELCHIISNPERLRGNPNNWFVEALCELSSVFTLRQMAERWRTQPPYPHWASYAASLAGYPVCMPVASGQPYLLKGAINLLLSSEEDDLRETSSRKEFGDFSEADRGKIAVFSHAMLPIFESQPTGWNSVRNVPETEGGLREYLADWYAQVEPIDKPFVGRILGIFGSAP